MTGQLPPLPAGYQLIPPGQSSTPALPPLPSGYRLIPQPGPGEQINDVGNKVIVPADGESFADTMQRAAAYGKTVTQPQIDAEMATAPKKAAQVLAAAPAIGAAGTASLAGAGELGAALVKNVPGLAKPAMQWISANPVKAYLAYKVADELGLGPSAIRKLLHLASGVEPE